MRLTKGELDKIEKRIDEINEILELTDENDIIDNLIFELENYKIILENSIKACKKEMLKIV